MARQVKSKPVGGVLISEKEISAGVSDMAREISADYDGRNFLAVVLLRGAFIFAADLLRRLEPQVSLRMEFMSVSSYGKGIVSSGEVRILEDLDIPIQDTDVLILDDILDSGCTISRVKDLAEKRGASSVRVATLLVKERSREHAIVPDYIGFRIPNVFVVGYGLDYAGYYRNLPDIRVLEDPARGSLGD